MDSILQSQCEPIIDQAIKKTERDANKVCYAWGIIYVFSCWAIMGQKRHRMLPKLLWSHVQIFCLTTFFTMPWGCWKHVFGIPGARPMFLKAELHKESKNGFKTINFRPPSVMIFSKNCFRSKKIIKKIGHFVDFWIFMAIYMNNLDQF